MNFDWIKQRLLEPSTWRGLTVIGGIAGVTISPDLANAIGVVVAGILGLIEIIRKEKKPAV